MLAKDLERNKIYLAITTYNGDFIYNFYKIINSGNNKINFILYKYTITAHTEEIKKYFKMKRSLSFLAWNYTNNDYHLAKPLSKIHESWLSTLIKSLF